jgi:hypothetical protein
MPLQQQLSQRGTTWSTWNTRTQVLIDMQLCIWSVQVKSIFIITLSCVCYSIKNWFCKVAEQRMTSLSHKNTIYEQAYCTKITYECVLAHSSMSKLLSACFVASFCAAKCFMHHMLGSKSEADYTCQQMEHGSSPTQLYSSWSAERATHKLQPSENIRGFGISGFKFDFSHVGAAEQWVH